MAKNQGNLGGLNEDNNLHISGCFKTFGTDFGMSNSIIIRSFKSKETDFVGFITKIHVLRFVDPLLCSLYVKKFKAFCILRIYICFLQKGLFFISFSVNLKKIHFLKRNFIV